MNTINVRIIISIAFVCKITCDSFLRLHFQNYTSQQNLMTTSYPDNQTVTYYHNKNSIFCHLSMFLSLSFSGVWWRPVFIVVIGGGENSEETTDLPQVNWQTFSHNVRAYVNFTPVQLHHVIPEIGEKSTIEFNSKVGLEANPIVFQFPTSTTIDNITINIDVHAVNDTQLTTFSKTVSLIFPLQTPATFILQDDTTNASITFTYSTKTCMPNRAVHTLCNRLGEKICETDYYGANCGTHCRVTNTTRGQCSQSGHLICEYGWNGTNCDNYFGCTLFSWCHSNLICLPPPINHSKPVCRSRESTNKPITKSLTLDVKHIAESTTLNTSVLPIKDTSVFWNILSTKSTSNTQTKSEKVTSSANLKSVSNMKNGTLHLNTSPTRKGKSTSVTVSTTLKSLIRQKTRTVHYHNSIYTTTRTKFTNTVNKSPVVSSTSGINISSYTDSSTTHQMNTFTTLLAKITNRQYSRKGTTQSSIFHGSVKPTSVSTSHQRTLIYGNPSTTLTLSYKSNSASSEATRRIVPSTTLTLRYQNNNTSSESTHGTLSGTTSPQRYQNNNTSSESTHGILSRTTSIQRYQNNETSSTATHRILSDKTLSVNKSSIGMSVEYTTNMQSLSPLNRVSVHVDRVSTHSPNWEVTSKIHYKQTISYLTSSLYNTLKTKTGSSSDTDRIQGTLGATTPDDRLQTKYTNKSTIKISYATYTLSKRPDKTSVSATDVYSICHKCGNNVIHLDLVRPLGASKIKVLTSLKQLVSSVLCRDVSGGTYITECNCTKRFGPLALTIVVTCDNGIPLSENQVKMMLSAKNFYLQFPNIRRNNFPITTNTTPSKDWLSSHWQLVLGVSLGATLVLVGIVVVQVCRRRGDTKGKARKENDRDDTDNTPCEVHSMYNPYLNPVYSVYNPTEDDV